MYLYIGVYKLYIYYIYNYTTIQLTLGYVSLHIGVYIVLVLYIYKKTTNLRMCIYTFRGVHCTCTTYTTIQLTLGYVSIHIGVYIVHVLYIQLYN